MLVPWRARLRNLASSVRSVFSLRKSQPTFTTNNAIYVIFPYNRGGAWVFDDATRNVANEPFVAGANTMIDVALQLKGIKNGMRGFRMTFSADMFPDHDFVLTQVGPSGTGTDYTLELDVGDEHVVMEGWLCSVLNRYINPSPFHLYVRIDAMTEDEQREQIPTYTPRRLVLPGDGRDYGHSATDAPWMPRRVWW